MNVTPPLCMRVKITIDNQLISDKSYEFPDTKKGSHQLTKTFEGREVSAVGSFHLTPAARKVINLLLVNGDIDLFSYQATTTEGTLATFTIQNISGFRCGACLRLAQINTPVATLPILESSYLYGYKDPNTAKSQLIYPSKNIDHFFSKSNLTRFQYKCESSAFMTIIEKLPNRNADGEALKPTGISFIKFLRLLLRS